MKIRVLLEVRWLEVVGPEDEQLVLGLLGLLLLDGDEASQRVEVRDVRGRVAGVRLLEAEGEAFIKKNQKFDIYEFIEG